MEEEDNGLLYMIEKKCNEQIERTSCEETPTIGGRKLCKYIGNELLSGNWSLMSRLQRKEVDVWLLGKLIWGKLS